MGRILKHFRQFFSSGVESGVRRGSDRARGIYIGYEKNQ